MHSVSTFFTSYSALVVVSGGDAEEPALRMVVVGDDGRAFLAPAQALDMYGAYPRDDEDELSEDDEDDA